MDQAQLIGLVTGPLGTLVLFIIIGVTGLRGDWIFGWIYRARLTDLKEERDQWKAIAQPAIEAAQQIAKLAAGREATR